MEITDAYRAPAHLQPAQATQRTPLPDRTRRTVDLVVSVVLLVLGLVLTLAGYVVSSGLALASIGRGPVTELPAWAEQVLTVAVWSPVVWLPLAAVAVVLLAVGRRAWPVALLAALLAPLGGAVATVLALVALG